MFLAVPLLMNIFIMLHIHFIPWLYEHRHYTTKIDCIMVLKNGILNNNLSIRVPNDHWRTRIQWGPVKVSLDCRDKLPRSGAQKEMIFIKLQFYFWKPHLAIFRFSKNPSVRCRFCFIPKNHPSLTCTLWKSTVISFFMINGRKIFF